MGIQIVHHPRFTAQMKPKEQPLFVSLVSTIPEAVQQVSPSLYSDSVDITATVKTLLALKPSQINVYHDQKAINPKTLSGFLRALWTIGGILPKLLLSRQPLVQWVQFASEEDMLKTLERDVPLLQDQDTFGRKNSWGRLYFATVNPEGRAQNHLIEWRV